MEYYIIYKQAVLKESVLPEIKKFIKWLSKTDFYKKLEKHRFSYDDNSFNYPSVLVVDADYFWELLESYIRKNKKFSIWYYNLNDPKSQRIIDDMEEEICDELEIELD